jgi:hypothetical protein
MKLKLILFCILVISLIACKEKTNNPLVKLRLDDLVYRNYDNVESVMEGDYSKYEYTFRPVKKNKVYRSHKIKSTHIPRELLRNNGIDLLAKSFSNTDLLSTLKERSLLNKKTKCEIYRFILLRSFDNPIVIRIEKNKGSYKVFWKLFEGVDDYVSGKMIVNQSKSIDSSNWTYFSNLLNRAKFWSIIPDPFESVGCDGSEWILEGVNSQKYHIVSRWSPTHGRFYDCCNYLIGLTDMKIDRKY